MHLPFLVLRSSTMGAETNATICAGEQEAIVNRLQRQVSILQAQLSSSSAAKDPTSPSLGPSHGSPAPIALSPSLSAAGGQAPSSMALPPPAISLGAITNGSDPLAPSPDQVMDALRRENESLRSRVCVRLSQPSFSSLSCAGRDREADNLSLSGPCRADVDRAFIHVCHLSDAYREEFVARVQLVLNRTSLIFFLQAHLPSYSLGDANRRPHPPARLPISSVRAHQLPSSPLVLRVEIVALRPQALHPPTFFLLPSSRSRISARLGRTRLAFSLVPRRWHLAWHGRPDLCRQSRGRKAAELRTGRSSCWGQGGCEGRGERCAQKSRELVGGEPIGALKSSSGTGRDSMFITCTTARIARHGGVR